MGNNPSAGTASSSMEDRNQQQGVNSETKWSSLFGSSSSSSAEEIRSYSRRVTEDVYDHMDPSGPKKLSTSPVPDIHEIIHKSATKMFQGTPKESEDPAERPYNQQHKPTLIDHMQQKVTNQKAGN